VDSRVAADYMRIRGSRGSVDISLTSTRHPLDAQSNEGNDDMGGSRCLLCRFVYTRETIRPGRTVMHANVSVEYEC